MSNLSLQTLTWGTVAAAIASALWLAAGDAELTDARAGRHGRAERAMPPLPGEPTAAGPARAGSWAAPRNSQDPRKRHDPQR
jgi:hypothetical protein